MDILFEELKNLTPSKIKKFSFKNLKTLIRIIKVLDGDTVTAIFKFKDEFYRSNFRIMGVDTPEIHSKIEEEKLAAVNAKKYLEELLLNNIVEAEFLEYDKYGRILINIFINDTTVSSLLISGGYAYEYTGGKKREWNI
jgi:micrococcal nuclease